MRLVAGAYPSYFHDPAANRDFLSTLGSNDRFGALELPIHGTSDDLTWPDGAEESWDAVVTQIPGTMAAMQTDEKFGLASSSVRGRADAVEFARHTFHRAQELKQSGHRVIAVELHGAPRHWCGTRFLAESLSRIAKWDWGETALVIEHCDAARQGRLAQKGFLELVEEIDAVSEVKRSVQTRLGISLNWARSAIEARSARAPYAHLFQARQAGLLAGLMFSSVSPDQTAFGPEWVDAHLAPAGVSGAPDSSLLTAVGIGEYLDALPESMIFLGFKVGLDGLNTPQERARAWSEMADLVR